MTIVSIKNEFIFIKCRKTAGTSLEILLSRYCDDKDIVTPIYPDNQHHRPRNYNCIEGNMLFYNHMPATRIRDLIPDIFDRSYKFCFERHPIDKCLSHFAMLLNFPSHQSESNPRTWNEYVELGEFPIDHQLYTDESGKLIVDKIYKYENLPEALVEISNITGLPVTNLNYYEKSGLRYGVPSFSEVAQSGNQTEIIMKAFEMTLQFVNYS
jgi:hypothetical protein